MADNDEQQVDSDVAAPDSTAPPVAEAAAEQPSDTIARLGRERSDAYDRMLRVAAEYENFKRRARREAEEATNRGREQVLKEILPVLDNLERAIEAVAGAGGGAAVESLVQGVRLVEKQLLGSLEKFEIRRFDAMGEAFDPAKHEAISQLETADFPPGAVARVFARGYTLGPRLIRPAMVAVAKAPAAAPPVDGGDVQA